MISSWLSSKGWVFWLIVILVIVLVVWIFLGGENHDFVGLKPLEVGVYNRPIDPWTKRNIRFSNIEHNAFQSNPYNRTQDQGSTDQSYSRENQLSSSEASTSNFLNGQSSNFLKEQGMDPESLITAISSSSKPKNPRTNQNHGGLIIEHKHDLLEDSMIPQHIKNISKIRPKASVKGYKKRYKGESLGETISRAALESLYPGHRFDKIRPDWLKNPKTGRNMELDGYCKELEIGFEYNGAQHYKYPSAFHKSEKQFLNQVERDIMKLDMCDALGVYVITIPYTVPKNAIKEFIEYYLPDNVMKRQQGE